MAPLISTCPCGAHTATLPAHIEEPGIMSFCHCTLCQHRTGSSFFVPAIFPGGDPTWLGLEAEPQSQKHTGKPPTPPTDVPKGRPYFLATINDKKGTPISYNTWRGEGGGSVNRAFCAQCGGTIAIWKITTPQGDPTPEEGKFLLLPAPNLSPSFDWAKMVTDEQKRDRVFNTWTGAARDIWPLGLTGAHSFTTQPDLEV